MNIQLTDEDVTFGHLFFQKYRGKEGSQYIAGKMALSYLSATLRAFSPNVILECGAGIGTITDALLSHKANVGHVFTTEDNDFCLAQLGINLAHHDPKRYTIIRNAEELGEIGPQVDLFVGDGGWGKTQETTPYDLDTVNTGTVIFVEGNRKPFRDKLADYLSHRTPPLHIEFHEYGVIYKRTLLMTHRFKIPLPRKIGLKRVKKGCWIGRAL